jgi:hypothetical protein
MKTSGLRTCILLTVAWAPAAGQAKQPGFSVASLPLVFTPNVGQDRTDIQYSARGFGYGISFTRQEVVLTMPKGKRPEAVLRMRVARSNPQATISGVEELPGKANFLLGRDPAMWRKGVPNFAKVMYRQILPGIDLIYYGRNLRLEYDFRVSPHADPAAIEMLLGSKEWSARVTPSGDLDIASAGGSIEFARPVAYQIAADGSRRPVKASYALKSRGGFGFHLGRYDRSRELVIDPTLVYSTYYGGTYYDSARGMAIDSQGNAYIVGATSSGDLPTTAGSLRPNAPAGLPSSTSATGYLAKFDSTGTQLIYATYIGGSSMSPIGFNQANAVAVDAGFNAYITGSTNSTDFPLKNEVQSTCGPENIISNDLSTCTVTPVSACGITVNGAQEDMFVMKLDPTGSMPVYSTYLGGSADDGGSGIAVDSAGNAYVVGNTLSITSYSSCGGCPGAPPDKSGFPTTPNPEFPNATTNAYLPTPVDYDPSCNRHKHGFLYTVLVELSSTGEVMYSTYIGSPSTSGVSSDVTKMALDNANNVYLGGLTNDPTFPVSAGAAQTQCSFCDEGNSYNAWVAKFNPALNGAAGLIYSTYLGGKAHAEADSIAVDPQGNAYVTGYTDASKGSNFPTTPGSFMPAAPAGALNAAFVAKLNQTGTQLLYSSYLGGGGNTVGNGIAVDATGAALVAGSTAEGFSFPLMNPLPYGGGDLDTCAANCGFLVQMTPDGSTDQFSTYFGWFSTSAGPAAVVADGAGNAWLAGTTNYAIPTTTGAYSTCLNTNCSSPPGISDAFLAKIDLGSACQTDQSAQLGVTRSGMRYEFASRSFVQTVSIKNKTSAAIAGPINLALVGLGSAATLGNATGQTGCTSTGNAYITVLASGSLAAGQSATVQLQFKDLTFAGFTYASKVLTGLALP